MGENGPIVVFLVDGDLPVRRGISELLSVEDDIAVAGEAATAAAALERVPAAHPEVAVVDARLPDGGGVAACREIRSHHEDVACLLLTPDTGDAAVLDALLAGAVGFVRKPVHAGDLLAAIRAVRTGPAREGVRRRGARAAFRARAARRAQQGVPARAEVRVGWPLLDPVATARVLRQTLNAPLGGHDRAVLNLMCAGLTNRALGMRLNRTEAEVRDDVARVLARLGELRAERRAPAPARRRRHRPIPHR